MAEAVGALIGHDPGTIGPGRPVGLVLAHLEDIGRAANDDDLIRLMDKLAAVMKKYNWPWFEMNAETLDIYFYRTREEGDLPTPPST